MKPEELRQLILDFVNASDSNRSKSKVIGFLSLFAVKVDEGPHRFVVGQMSVSCYSNTFYIDVFNELGDSVQYSCDGYDGEPLL